MDIQQLKSEFDREGYTRIEGFMNPNEISEIDGALSRYLEEVVPTLEKHKALYDTIDGEPVLKQLVDMHNLDSYFHDLVHSEKMKGIASDLLGETAVPRNVEYFYKAPQRGTPTPPHQDGYYFCLKPNHALTLWLALVDCDEGNGCLNYVRASHLGEIHGHGDSGVVGFSQGLQGVEWTEEEVAHMRLHAGDLLAHHSKTIHFADGNQSDRPRKALGFIYFAESAQRDEEAWDRYMGSLERQRAGTA
ncbi:MAG: phytanoyl-CoA dioxygenase family protein [Candidatus Omnitrophica bacterium]|nr:phytanoyl-CoA dioxygenase family protein [Candidatus Omnitrophota bacterium]